MPVLHLDRDDRRHPCSSHTWAGLEDICSGCGYVNTIRGPVSPWWKSEVQHQRALTMFMTLGDSDPTTLQARYEQAMGKEPDLTPFEGRQRVETHDTTERIEALLQRHQDIMSPWEKGFLPSVIARLRQGRQLSDLQREKLDQIMDKCSRRIGGRS